MCLVIINKEIVIFFGDWKGGREMSNPCEKLNPQNEELENIWWIIDKVGLDQKENKNQSFLISILREHLSYMRESYFSTRVACSELDQYLTIIKSPYQVVTPLILSNTPFLKLALLFSFLLNYMNLNIKLWQIS